MGRVPERTCIGCRTKRPKGDLLRLVRRPDGRVGVDPSGSAPGRGAYVDRDRECIRLARRRGAFARALRSTLRPEDLATLVEEIERELA
jgi:predicted RNA-binding protein YlxR (DUF448 family)